MFDIIEMTPMRCKKVDNKAEVFKLKSVHISKVLHYAYHDK